MNRFAFLLLVFVACRSPEPSETPQPVAVRTIPAEQPSAMQPSAMQAQAPAAMDIGGAVAATETPSGNVDPRLLNPRAATEQAPPQFAVELDTTKGSVVIDVTREWAPLGADRFYNLVRMGYFTDVAFFRVLDGFMAQGGIHGDPAVNRAWRDANIQDDPVRQRNTRGMLSYAMGGPNTRTTQFFINYGDNTRLDGMGFAPFGRVRDMRAVDALYKEYGEGAPSGRGPAQARVQSEGNAYLRQSFPNLDYIRSARIVP